MRIILDTNTVISGLLWRGKPFEVLELVRSRQVIAYTSKAILEELLDVLQRPKFSKKLALLESSPQKMVYDWISWVEVVEVKEVAKVVISDPDDDQIIACAKLANADFIISGDTDLLNIKAEVTIPIVNAGEFIDIFALEGQ